MGDQIPIVFEALKKLCIDDIEINSFRVSCTSDGAGKNGGMNVIGILFLKCPEGAKTTGGRSIRPGYVHLKTLPNLENIEGPQYKTLHHKCFASVCGGELNDNLVMGFGVNCGRDGMKLKSGTFNSTLNSYLGVSYDREAMEFFTPILQVIMRKYKGECRVGFNVPLEFVPLEIF